MWMSESCQLLTTCQGWALSKPLSNGKSCSDNQAAVLRSSGQHDCAEDEEVMDMAEMTLSPLFHFLIMPCRSILPPAKKLVMVPPTGSQLIYAYPLVSCMLQSEESSTRGRSRILEGTGYDDVTDYPPGPRSVPQLSRELGGC